MLDLELTNPACRNPSSGSARQKHRETAKKFRLPEGYQRIANHKLLRLLHGRKTKIISQRREHRKCFHAARDLYYDVDAREEIDWMSFGTLKFYLKDVEAVT
jgi:hypothetical protein